MASKSKVSAYQQGVEEQSGKIDLSGLASVITGGIAGGITVGLSAFFDQATLETEAFQEVINAIEAVGDVPTAEGYNIVSRLLNLENLNNYYNPAEGLKNKYDFSAVLNGYAAGLDKVIYGDVAAGVLLAVGFYALKKDKKLSSALLGASTGGFVYSAVTASQYAGALNEMPFQIGGEALTDYCTNNPTFAEPLVGLVNDLSTKLNTSKWVSAGLAALAGALFIYSATKNIPKDVSNYTPDMIE